MESRGCDRSKAKLRPSVKFKACPIGFFQVDIAEVRTAQGKRYLFVAIDRPHESGGGSRAFLEALVAAVPYRVEIALADNGVQFADLANEP